MRLEPGLNSVTRLFKPIPGAPARSRRIKGHWDHLNCINISYLSPHKLFWAKLFICVARISISEYKRLTQLIFSHTVQWHSLVFTGASPVKHQGCTGFRIWTRNFHLIKAAIEYYITRLCHTSSCTDHSFTHTCCSIIAVHLGFLARSDLKIY